MGIDLARAAAILGMLAVHVGPTGNAGVAGRIYALPHGRASLLFVLLAGAGLSLLAASRDARELRHLVLWRAAVLLPMGLVLQLLPHGAHVILAVYAALFVVAVPATRLSDRALVGAVALTATIGPALHLWGTMRAPAVFERTPVSWGDPPAELLHELALSGPYPLVVWIAPLLFGMWLGRRDLRAPRVVRRMILAGGGVTFLAAVTSLVLEAIVARASVPSWVTQAVVQTPHSQRPLWLIGGTATATALLGLSILVTRTRDRWSAPFVSTGRLALTLYVGHLVVLALLPDLATSERVLPALLRVGIATVTMVAFAHVWLSRFPRGPLEAMLRPPTWLFGADRAAART